VETEVKEISGNIWDYYDKGNWIVITTNGTIKQNGECVMGRGVALDAKIRFPEFPLKLGYMIEHAGNIVADFPKYRIITFPVKNNWFEKADINLIEKSCRALKELMRVSKMLDKFSIIY